MNRSLSRALGLLVAVFLCLGAGAVTAPSAHAEGPALSVQLTGISVTGTTGSSEVVLSGTVSNTGTVPAYGMQVIFWHSPAQIRDVATLDSVTHGGAVPDGARVVSSEANYTRPYDGGKPFTPSTKTTFTVRATLAELGISTTSAAYAVGVDVRGNGNGSSTYQTLAKSRTVVPIAGSSAAAETAPLVLFSSQPSITAQDRFADDHLAKELAAGGRLDKLMAAVEDDKLSWVIDPSLLAEIRAMTDGYTVTGTGESAEGTGSDVAEAWLKRYDKLPRATGYQTLFATPDVATAARLQQKGLLKWALDAAKQVDDLGDLPTIVLPSGMAADATTVAYLADSGAAAIATHQLTSSATWVNGTVPVLRVSDPDAPTGVAAQVGQANYLASEALVLSALGHTQVRVVSTAADLTLLQDAPTWISLTKAQTVLDEKPATGSPTYSASSTDDALPDADIAGLTGLADQLDAYADLSPTAPTSLTRTQILSRAASSTWVGEAAERSAWLSAATADLTAASKPDAVELAATSRFVMSGKANEFPITVTNRLPDPVTVSVHLTSSNPQRLEVSASEAITVNPGESRTINIRPVATSNGIATVTAQLTTSGDTRIGAPIEITVEATQYGVIGWVLVAISGIVLIATTAWSLRKNRGRTRAEEAA